MCPEKINLFRNISLLARRVAPRVDGLGAIASSTTPGRNVQPSTSNAWSLWMGSHLEKRVFADIIQFRILRRHHPGLPEWVLPPMTGVLMGHTEERRMETREDEEKVEAEIGVVWPQAKRVSDHQKLDKTRLSLRASSGRVPCWHLDLRFLESRNLREFISVALSHQGCCSLLQQPQVVDWITSPSGCSESEPLCIPRAEAEPPLSLPWGQSCHNPALPWTPAPGPGPKKNPLCCDFTLWEKRRAREPSQSSPLRT